jgi:hypothetical protein
MSLALVTALVVAQTSHILPNDLRAVYRTQQMQFRSGDVKMFFSRYDPSYVSINPQGKKSNLKELKMVVEKLLKGTSKRDVTLNYTGVTVKGNQAVISYTCLIDLNWPDGRQMHTKEVGTDTWIKKNGKWTEMKTVDKFFGPAK